MCLADLIQNHLQKPPAHSMLAHISGGGHLAAHVQKDAMSCTTSCQTDACVSRHICFFVCWCRADHSSTAYDYCMRPDNAAAAQGFGGGGPMALAARFAMPPPPGLVGTSAAAWMAAMGMGGGNVSVTTNTFVNGVQVGHTHQTGGPVYKMVIARVALGQQAQGQAGMRRPPDGYDSVNSGRVQVQAGNPYCHVIFDNDQAYPEYLVTLRP